MPHYKYQNNQIHFLDSKEHSHLLPQGCVEITDQEADAISAASIVLPTHHQLRAAAYPPIPDQLDTIFHGGLDVWKAQIQAVKDSIPKEKI